MADTYDDSDDLKAYILVADDDTVIRMVIQRMLQQAGYGADFVSNGQEVLGALESRHYDLLVMDCDMPLLDGFATTSAIRTTSSSRFDSAIPVIALTGLSEKSDRRRCLDAGMNAFVSKPVDSHALIAAVEQCLTLTTADSKVSRQNEIPADQLWEDNFLDTIIASFLAEVPQLIAGLERAVRRGDVVELEKTGHRLRGATDILGATTLSERSKALEKAGKTGDIALAGTLVSGLIKELNKLTATLDE